MDLLFSTYCFFTNPSKLFSKSKTHSDEFFHGYVSVARLLRGSNMLHPRCSA